MSTRLQGNSRPQRREHQALTPLLDIEEIADVLGVSVRYVRRLVFERRIPYVKWGRYLRFEPDAIAAWLEDARISPSR